MSWQPTISVGVLSEPGRLYSLVRLVIARADVRDKRTNLYPRRLVCQLGRKLGLLSSGLVFLWFFADEWITNVEVTVSGFVSVLFIPLPFLLYKYGHIARERSSKAQS